MGKYIIKINLKEFEILYWILNWLRDLDFMTKDRDKWWAVVNKAMNCPIHKVIGFSWLAEELSACQ